MNDRNKTVLAYIGIGLAAALIAGGIVWAVLDARASDAEERADFAEGQVAELESQMEGLTDRGDPAEATAQTESEDSESEPPAAESESGSSEDGSSEDGRHFCYVRDVVNETGTTMVTVDYADMLTGDEAAAAATAAGVESPPPNDFFISNVNPLLRTFPVQAGISVTLVTRADGLVMEGYSVPLGQWQDFFIGMSPGMEVVQDVPYWIEIEGGVVTAIEEQYLP